MSKIPLSEFGMSKRGMIAGSLYFSFMIIIVGVTLYFGLIPLERMGIRLDTLPMGVALGIVCQIPMFLLTFVNARRLKKGSGEERMFMKLMKHARMHAIYAVFDAPIAESFWSGIVLSSLVAFLVFLGFNQFLASLIGIIVGTGIHIFSHTGPLRPLFGEGAPLKGVFIVMALNRTVFIISNNLIAPILGHFLFAYYILAGWRIARTRSKAGNSFAIVGEENLG